MFRIAFVVTTTAEHYNHRYSGTADSGSLSYVRTPAIATAIAEPL